MEWKSWSETTNLPHQLTFINHQSVGTQNAGLIVVDIQWQVQLTKAVVLKHFKKLLFAWDGLSYSIIASMDNERANGGVVGSMNSALAQGGSATFHHSTCTEEWNGSVYWIGCFQIFQLLLLQQLEHQTMLCIRSTDASSPVRTGCTDFYNGVSCTDDHLLD